jgi:hypothetical protein
MNLPMFRPTILFALVLTIGLSASACDSDDPITPTEPEPIAVTETFTGTLTRNGAVRETFVTQRAGNVSATIVSLAPDSAAVVSLSLGTWNGQSCQVIIAKDDATSTPPLNSIIGTASAGNFCLRLSDPNGSLAQATDYTVSVTHF